MKDSKFSAFAAALAVAFSLWFGGVFAEPITEIPAGETFYVGGAGSDPYNTQGDVKNLMFRTTILNCCKRRLTE